MGMNVIIQSVLSITIEEIVFIPDETGTVYGWAVNGT